MVLATYIRKALQSFGGADALGKGTDEQFQKQGPCTP